MANSKKLFQELLNKITLTDREEAEAILFYLFEARAGLRRDEILLNKPIGSSIDFTLDINRINVHEPVQYVSGYAWFCNRKFEVNSSVLIPRPETEELIYEVLKSKLKNPAILDVGTGSGCIAITLALEMAGATIFAIDKSEAALVVAKNNAKRLNAEIQFLQSDFLKEQITFGKQFDLVVSNPPYVRELEKHQMEQTVLRYEPPLALFVPNEQPLLFYEALAKNGRNILKEGGKIVAEINSAFGSEVKSLFESNGYHEVALMKDVAGRNRIVFATL
jgi:release factor glutamine methyltransferase